MECRQPLNLTPASCNRRSCPPCSPSSYGACRLFCGTSSCNCTSRQPEVRLALTPVLPLLRPRARRRRRSATWTRRPRYRGRRPAWPRRARSRWTWRRTASAPTRSLFTFQVFRNDLSAPPINGYPDLHACSMFPVDLVCVKCRIVHRVVHSGGLRAALVCAGLRVPDAAVDAGRGHCD